MKSWKSGESAAAKLLKDWWGVPFFRTPESGGMATSRHDSLPPSVVSNLVGDIVCDLRGPNLNPAVSFPFISEVKAYAKINLYALPRRGAFDIQPGSKPKDENDLWLCWYQAKIEAYRGNRWPLLLFKEDRKQWYVGFPTSPFLDLGYGDPPDLGGTIHLHRRVEALVFLNMAIMSWEKFAKTFPRERVERIAQTAINDGTLRPPERWVESVDLNVSAEVATGNQL